MQNSLIRQTAKAKKVPLWAVADKLNISEPTMTRKLRHELPPEETAHILALIDQLAKEATQ